MTRTTLRAAFVAALLATSAMTMVGDPAFAQRAPSITAAVGKNLQDAKKALDAKDFPTALAAIEKAKGVSSKKEYDDFVISQYELQAQIGVNNIPAAAAAAEVAASYKDLSAEQKPGILRNAMVLALNAKHYDKALEFGKQIEALTPPPDEHTQGIIMQAYYFAGDYPGTANKAKAIIDGDIAAGKRPSKDALDFLIQARIKQKDEAGAEDALMMRINALGDPEDWTQMIDVVLGTKGLRDIDAVYLARLMFATGAKVSQQDANIFGQTSSKLTFFGDTVQASQHGGTGFPDATARMAEDKKTLPKQIADAPKQNGQYNVKLAQALYSYGMYQEAETAAQAAMTKPGATDPTEAPMVLGMTQVALGKYDDAVATFAKVNGGSPATPRIAKMWSDYAKLKKNPPTP
jgi:tetratricopeptide (TPR) repeat protein